MCFHLNYLEIILRWSKESKASAFKGLYYLLVQGLIWLKSMILIRLQMLNFRCSYKQFGLNIFGDACNIYLFCKNMNNYSTFLTIIGSFLDQICSKKQCLSVLVWILQNSYFILLLEILTLYFTNNNPCWTSPLNSQVLF